METTQQATGRTYQRGPEPPAPAAVPSPGTIGPAAPRIDWDALRAACRSCCCPARPAVVALVPPGPGRPHRTDLLLCMHHFRGARQQLATAGASVLDMRGKLIDPSTPAYLVPDTPAAR